LILAFQGWKWQSGGGGRQRVATGDERKRRRRVAWGSEVGVEEEGRQPT
jgi:hypothetical protein